MSVLSRVLSFFPPEPVLYSWVLGGEQRTDGAWEKPEMCLQQAGKHALHCAIHNTNHYIVITGIMSKQTSKMFVEAKHTDERSSVRAQPQGASASTQKVRQRRTDDEDAHRGPSVLPWAQYSHKTNYWLKTAKTKRESLTSWKLEINRNKVERRILFFPRQINSLLAGKTSSILHTASINNVDSHGCCMALHWTCKHKLIHGSYSSLSQKWVTFNMYN